MNWILLIGAIVVSILIFMWLFKVMRATLGTAIAIAVVVLVLQVAFGVAPKQVWQELMDIWTAIRRAIGQ